MRMETSVVGGRNEFFRNIKNEKYKQGMSFNMLKLNDTVTTPRPRIT